jgi:ATP-dependent helicase/nuclease subunit A
LQNVVLEASAGTGKTRVLVERYVNLLRAGAEQTRFSPSRSLKSRRRDASAHIERRKKPPASQFDAARWRDLGDRLGDIAISTIDAFCLSLLREFLSRPTWIGFGLADEHRCRGSSANRSTARCASVGAWRRG